MNRNQLADVLLSVVGTRGGDAKLQAPTAALGWRENWRSLFVAIQGSPVSQELATSLANACQPVLGYFPDIIDARENATNDYNWMRGGKQTASAHAEMLVLVAMMKHRMDNAFRKQLDSYQNTGIAGKYDQVYVSNRYENRRDIAVLAAKFNSPGHRIRIVANAPACYFCWNILNDLNVECGGLDVDGQLDFDQGKHPNTGWWNPINDTGYSHGTSQWASQVPGIR